MLEFIGIIIEGLCLTGDIPKHWSPEDRRLIRNIILGGIAIALVLGAVKFSMSS